MVKPTSTLISLNLDAIAEWVFIVCWTNWRKLAGALTVAKWVGESVCMAAVRRFV